MVPIADLPIFFYLKHMFTKFITSALSEKNRADLARFEPSWVFFSLDSRKICHFSLEEML